MTATGVRREKAALFQNKRSNIGTKKLTKRCPAWLLPSPDRASFTVNEERAAVIRQIFDDSAAGIGNYSIARRLNKSGISAFVGKIGWHTSSVSKVLMSRAVLGEFQPHRLINGKRIAEGESISGYFPAIISEDAFYRAETARAQRRVGGGGRRGNDISNLFSRIATCDYCNSRMQYVNKGRGPKGGAYLVCGRAKRGMGCVATGRPYEQFEALFLGYVEELDLEPLVRSDDEKATRTALDEEIAALEGRKSVLERQRDKTYELLSEESVGVDYVRGRLRQCESELVKMEAEVAAKKKLRATLQSDVSRFYESKEQIKSLIKRLQLRGDGEVYKLRAQVSSKLASLVSSISVATLGFAPTIQRWLDEMKLGVPGIGQAAASELVRDYEESLRDPRNHRRHFVVTFKEGDARSVSE